MTPSRDEIAKIARLAHLCIEGSELERFSKEFARILGFFERLTELDTSGVEPMSHVGSDQGVKAAAFRPDTVRAGLPMDEVFAEAPDVRQGHFIVPKVIT